MSARTIYDNSYNIRVPEKNIGSANQIVITFRENDDLQIDEEERKEKGVMEGGRRVKIVQFSRATENI